MRRHVQEELQSLPNVTCIETITRSFRAAKGALRPLDTVRLEVLTNGHKELFSSPGGRKFSEQPPVSYVGSGVLGDGLFGPYLQTVVVGGNGWYQYKGEEVIGERLLSRWDFRMPVMWAGQRINLPEGAGNVGLSGSFWADAHTYEVTRLLLNAVDFPPTLPLAEAVTVIDFRQFDLGGNAPALLPASGDFRMVRLSGETSINHTEFSDCRLFQGETTVSFADPDAMESEARFAIAQVDDTIRDLPSGVFVTVKLREKVSDEMAVGSLIKGEVASDVWKGHRQLIKKGSPVLGRIRRMEHYTEPYSYFAVAFDFTELSVDGIRYRFRAELIGLGRQPGLEERLTIANTTERKGSVLRTATESVYLHPLPGAAVFFMRGRKVELPVGFSTVWRTSGPADR
ncbi:MAG TPA: hypothetical protein VKV15_01185 [Bryobacteraceae bacterium]|nr:hypothetical protein [Bryobacteraceae bacterium]